MEDTLWGYWKIFQKPKSHFVLILILMEDTLWGLTDKKMVIEKFVLILILMEDTLWENEKWSYKHELERVLILILMEDTLWESISALNKK